MPDRAAPKYQVVLDLIEGRIVHGQYGPGQKLPGESGLVKEFGASRITIGRAIRELQRKGLVERKAGSGTYVRRMREGVAELGLLIPDLGETEILEPICRGIAGASREAENMLVCGGSRPGEGQAAEAERLCRSFIRRGVRGVFFTPLERVEGHDKANTSILSLLEEAGVPVVLVDRSVHVSARPNSFDLVSLDHRGAAFMITEHLWKLGARRIAFVAHPGSASSVDLRIAGYGEALSESGSKPKPGWVRFLDASDQDDVQSLINQVRPDAVVCANDRTAGEFMQTLLGLGLRVPEDVRVVGFDDVRYARLLPVPLTTVRQPCREIGEAAWSVMQERVRRPDMPARQVYLSGDLVVRKSCGAPGH